MSTVTHILYADGLKRGSVLLKRVLAPAHGNFEVTEVSSLDELKEALRSGTCDLVLSELDLPGCEGMSLVDTVQALHPGLPLVVLTADTDRALEAMQRGVADCLSKTPQQLARLPHILRRVLERQRLEREKRQVEEHLHMVTRARTVMAECNRILIRATDENQLLRDMCRIVVESGGYRTAWVGLVHHDEAKTIEPVASAGEYVDHLAAAKISWGTDVAGQGPTGAAVRSRKSQAVRRIQTDPFFSKWRQHVVECGFEAAASLPLISGDVVLGVLGILSSEPDAFDGGELALLEELAHDIAYGLSNLRLRATQQRAEQLLRLEHSVTRCIAEADGAASALKSVIRAVCKTEGWDCGRYFRLDEAAMVLRFDEGWGVESKGIQTFLERSQGLSYAPGVGLIGKSWQSGEPLWIADLTTDGRAVRAAYTAESGVRGAFLFPVTSEGRTIGVLGFSSREIREPDERLLQAAHVIGSQIGQFVQRRRNEEELQRFRAAMDTSSDMIMLVDRATMRYIDVNATACEMQGYTREEMLRKGPQDVGGLTREELERSYDEMIASGQTTWMKSVHRRKDGTFVPVEIFRRAARSDRGWIIVAIVRDVSERVRAEQLQNLEHAVAHSLSECEDSGTALQAVMRAMCETEDWDCGLYLRVDEAAGLLRTAASWCVSDPAIERFVESSREATIERGAGVPGQAWDTGEPLWSADVRNEPGAARPAVGTNDPMRGVLAFPVTAEGKTAGVLVFASRAPREPDDRLLRAVRAIGSQIGQFLQRKDAQAVLRESEERFRSLTTLSSDWYWEQDAEYRFVDMSNEIDRRTGVSASSHIGKRRWELSAPNMTDAAWTAHRALVEAHQPFQDLELNRIAGDGSSHWVSISGEPMHDAAGRFKGYRGIGKDITARKREEKLLALEHAVTRSLAGAESAESGLQAAIRVMCETQDWECGRYFHADDFAGVLRFAAAWHVPGTAFEQFVERSRTVVFGHGGGLVGRVWDSGEPLWSPDIRNDPRSLRKSHSVDMGVRAQFDIPVTAEGKTIGVLIFSSREVREPDDRLLRAVSAIGSQIGQFLQRKEADEKIRRQALQQRLIAEFGQQALASGDIGDVLHRATALVSSTLDVEFADVLELEPDGEQLRYRAVSGWPEAWVGHRLVSATPGSRVHYVLTQGEPFLCENFEESAGFNASRLAVLGVKSGARVPILGSRGAFGLLGVHSRERRRYTEDDVSFLRSVANILAIAVERKNAEDQLAHLAEFDTVTGLPNRHLFRDRLGQSLTQARRSGRQVAVLFIDLDRFKAVNDTYGHAVGDTLLKQVAARLGECVRSADTVARISGDEFALVLSGMAKADDAGMVAQKVVNALAAPFELDGHQAYISASIGVSLYPGDGDQVDTLLKNADTAMYRAKQQGRNGYQFYLPEMNERLMERLQLETKLRGALDRSEFRLHYQPKVSLDTGAISGFEALLRWQNGERLVSPADFIPILEDTGLIVPVGEWVLRGVCEQIRQWQERGIAARPVAINLSTRQFQHKNLVLMVAQILRETGVAPDLLELELTESLLMGDAKEAAEMLHELKSLGVRLSIDDFGTGYSSLAYLKRFPLDTLKIDREFIRDTVTDPDDATLTLTIINLAHSMRLKVVAEGVETGAQLDFLRRNGCDEMQGYYFARPMPAEECLQALIEDRRLADVATPGATRLRAA
ncbi:MAG TPA: GAF domain-containing protein [Burkholderiales bacterium]|nr:GAF domain-containing protein [Burkholderiales bacterium]